MKKIGMSYIKSLVLEALRSTQDAGRVEPWPQSEPLTQRQITQLIGIVNSKPPSSVAGGDAWPQSEPLTTTDRSQLTAALQALSRTAPK